MPKPGTPGTPPLSEDRRKYNKGSPPGKVNCSHRMSLTRIYRIWRNMLTRCYNAKSSKYSNYGGRGIKVCERWRGSFENFYADVGDPPTDKHSLDRINTNGDYTSENTRWATQSRQCRNRVNTKLYEHNGVSKSLPDWADEFGVTISFLTARVIIAGWTIEKAISTPNKQSLARSLDMPSLIERYKAGESMNALATEVGVACLTLRNKMVKLGVDIRSLMEARHLR